MCSSVGCRQVYGCVTLSGLGDGQGISAKVRPLTDHIPISQEYGHEREAEQAVEIRARERWKAHAEILRFVGVSWKL